MRLVTAFTLITTALGGMAGGAVAQQAPGRAVAVDGGGQYRDIMVPELQAMLQQKNFPLVNVHVPYAGDIPLTDASIRYDEIASHLDQLPADKNAPIVLYCRSGRRSSLAQDRLLEMGYRHVINAGGYQDFGVRLAER